MDRLTWTYAALARINLKLIHVLQKLRNVGSDADIDTANLDAYRDSVIKNFEIGFDLLWKYLKLYLERYYAIEVLSPKKAFQEALTQKLISEAELDLLLEMSDCRNQTTHVYSEDLANDTVADVERYSFLFEQLVKRLKPQV